MIHKLRFELKIPNREMAHAIQNRISDWSRGALSEELEKVCENFAGEREHWVVPRLELDLGSLSSEALEKDLVVALQRELPEALGRLPAPVTPAEPNALSGGNSQEVRDGTTARTPLTPFEFHAQWLSHYLRWGTAPWWADASEWPGLSGVLDVLEENGGKANVSRVLQDVLQQKTARRRFVRQLAPDSHDRWLERLLGFPVPGSNVLQTLHASLKDFFKGGLPSTASLEGWYECQWEYWSRMGENTGADSLWRALGDRLVAWYEHLPRNTLRPVISQALSGTGVGPGEVSVFLEGIGWDPAYITGRKSEMDGDVKAEGLDTAGNEGMVETNRGAENRLDGELRQKSSNVSEARDEADAPTDPGAAAAPVKNKASAQQPALEAAGKKNKPGDLEKKSEGAAKEQPAKKAGEKPGKGKRPKTDETTASEIAGEKMSHAAGDAVKESPHLEEALEEQAAQGWVVENAGLVLLWPYFKTLFESLQWVRGGRFRDEDNRERGLHLLHYLVYNREEPEEHALLLNKIFCAWPLNRPVKRWLPLTDAERREGDALLDAAMEHWKALGKSSRPALRETFLIRRGILVSEDGLWRLRVEKGPYDMLLDKLPWGFSLVYLSWMEKRLHVEWT